MSKFATLADRGPEVTGSFTEIELLPDFEKERLCRELLGEFGVGNVQATNGGELIHSCPLPFGLHANGDRNPSASLNWQTLTFNCFTCGGGGLLWLIAVCRDTSSTAARKWLLNEAGIGSEEQPLAKVLEFIDAVYDRDRKRHTAPLPRFDERVLDPWLVIHPYMTEIRRVPVASLEHFKVGYGVIPTRTKDGSVESHRIVIPHFWRDRLVGWQSRRLTDDGTPKYKSTPDFPKDSTLFNLTNPRGEVVLVESPLSALRHGLDLPLVATFGASVTDSQVRLVSKADRAVLWFDNDNAGWKATEDVAERLGAHIPVYVVESPYAADPADLEADEVAHLISKAVPYSIWRRPESLVPIPEVV